MIEIFRKLIISLLQFHFLKQVPATSTKQEMRKDGHLFLLKVVIVIAIVVLALGAFSSIFGPILKALDPQ